MSEWSELADINNIKQKVGIMNKITLRLIIALTILFAVGCGETKIIDGIEYDTYGLFDEAEKRNPNIQYEIIPGNIVWSIVLVETIGAPIYFIGFSMYEPIGLIDKNKIIGSIDKGKQ